MALGDVEIPAPGEGEVLVQTFVSVVSPGTELRCLAGAQPDSLPWPYIPGYALAGQVVEGEGIRAGTLAFCAGTSKAEVGLMWGGHIGHAVVPATAVYPAPEGLSPVAAAITGLAAIAMRGVRLTRPALGQSVAVLGLGPIGQLSARLMSLAGADIVAVDRIPERVAVAERAGIRAVVAKEDIGGTVRSVFPKGAEILVDATGSTSVIGRAINAARDKPWGDSQTPGATLVIQGSYPGDLPVPYQDAFLKELTLLFARSYQPSDLRSVLALMAGGRLEVEDIVSEVRKPDEAPQVYANLAGGGAGAVTVGFDWTDG